MSYQTYRIMFQDLNRIFEVAATSLEGAVSDLREAYEGLGDVLTWSVQ